MEADSSTYSKSHEATEPGFFLENLRILGITHPPQSPDPSHLVKHRALGKYSQDTHWTPRVDAPVIPWKIVWFHRDRKTVTFLGHTTRNVRCQSLRRMEPSRLPSFSQSHGLLTGPLFLPPAMTAATYSRSEQIARKRHSESSPLLILLCDIGSLKRLCFNWGPAR